MNENCKTKRSLSEKKQSLNTRVSLQLPKSVAVISHNRRSADNYTGNGKNSNPIDTKLMQTKNSSEKYATPELNSALVLKKHLNALNNATTEKLTDFNQMTPRTKAIATEKVCICSRKRNEKKLRSFHLIDFIIYHYFAVTEKTQFPSR